MSATKIGPSRPCKNEKCINVIFINFSCRRECSKCRSRKWSKKNRLKRFWFNLRHSARRREIGFHLVPYSDFRKWCYKNSFIPKSYLPRKDRPSIDRIEETGDYTFDNIQVLTVSANSSKFEAYKRSLELLKNCNDANDNGNELF